MKRQAYILYIVLATLFLAGCSSNELVTRESKDITNQDDDDTTLPINDSYTYKLPIIFHVLYTEDNDSVRALATQLPRVLGFVNELYQGNVYSWRGVYSQNINVDFQPALSDEEGKLYCRLRAWSSRSGTASSLLRQALSCRRKTRNTSGNQTSTSTSLSIRSNRIPWAVSFSA